MCDDFDFASDDHTLVCNKCETRHRPDARSRAFLDLIQHHVDQDPRPLSDLAALLGISRRQLGRILGGKRPLRLAELRTLTDLLDIDRARATVAIEVIGDWRSYDDAGLSVVMCLLKPVVMKLRERADFPIEPLTKPAQDTLSDWLADSIITNEEQIRHRRDAFIKLPQL